MPPTRQLTGVPQREVSRMVVYGHSLPFGGGASDTDRDLTTHLASMLKIREVPRATGGAILHWSQAAVSGDGGYAHVLQNEVRKNRANTTLSAQATAGATTLSVTAGAAFVNGDCIFVGIGASGATGGELLYVTSGGGTNTLTVRRPDGTTTTARTHLNGEPVYVVPTAYQNLTALYLLWYGNNDLPTSPITGTSDTLRANTFKCPLRQAISRCRAAEVYEETHKSCVYTGAWTPANSTSTCSGTAVTQPTTNTSVVTIHTPENFPGGTIALAWESLLSTGFTNPVVGVTVDGNSAGSIDWPVSYSGKYNATVKRLTGLAAGRHTIVCSMTTVGTAGNVFFDGWWIESTIPPVTLVMGALRPYSYTILWPTHPNTRRTTTLTGTHNSGTTSWTVGSTANMLPGATVTFEEGVGNQEILEVLTVPNGTTFTTAASTLNHAGGITVVYGNQDADVAKLNVIQSAVCAEFDSSATFFAADAIINKDLQYFWHDGAHLNDLGHAVMTNALADVIAARTAGSIPAYTSSPSAPLPSLINFVTTPGATPTAGSQWTDMPAALTELFGVSAHRKFADLRRAVEGRFVVGVKAVGFSGSGLRIRYSIDLGVTWKYLFRTALFAEDTTHEAILTTVGMKDSGWRPIAAEALVDNVWLSIWGINGNGVIDTFVPGTVDLYLR